MNNRTEKNVKISDESYQIFAEAKKDIKERGGDISFKEFTDKVFKSSSQVIADIIEEHTPEEFLIKNALKDEALKNQVLKLIKSQKTKQRSLEI